MNGRMVHWATVLLLCSGCSTLPNRYVVPGGNAPVTFEKMMEQVGDRQVVFLGEFHAHRRSQRLELEVIKTLHRTGRKVVVALEMFPASRQVVLDQWVGGGLQEDRFERFFRKNVRLPYGNYRDIFAYARQNGIRLAGINAERNLVSLVSKKGFDRVPRALVERLELVSCNEDPGYANFHKAIESRTLHRSRMPFLCDAQRLRDAFMAHNVAGLVRGDRPVVVVLVGAIHASRVAVPRLLQRYETCSDAVIMPWEMGSTLPDVQDESVADYLWY